MFGVLWFWRGASLAQPRVMVVRVFRFGYIIVRDK